MSEEKDTRGIKNQPDRRPTIPGATGIALTQSGREGLRGSNAHQAPRPAAVQNDVKRAGTKARQGTASNAQHVGCEWRCTGSEVIGNKFKNRRAWLFGTRDDCTKPKGELGWATAQRPSSRLCARGPGTGAGAPAEQGLPITVDRPNLPFHAGAADSALAAGPDRARGGSPKRPADGATRTSGAMCRSGWKGPLSRLRTCVYKGGGPRGAARQLVVSEMVLDGWPPRGKLSEKKRR